MLNKPGVLYLTMVSLLLSCKTAEFGYKVVDVNGMVYDYGNRPVANCGIYLNDELKAETDINGRFSMAGIPDGDYVIRLQKKGYEMFSGDIRIHDPKQVVYLRIPALQQLLDMADNCLEKNQVEEAMVYIERALSIGEITTELFFYAAVVEWRRGNVKQAGAYLRLLKTAGVHDVYVEKFLEDIMKTGEAKDEE